jgi:hypothetical protein
LLEPSRVRALTAHMKIELPPAPAQRKGRAPRMTLLKSIVQNITADGLIVNSRSQACTLAITARNMGFRLTQKSLGDGRILMKRAIQHFQP